MTAVAAEKAPRQDFDLAAWCETGLANNALVLVWFLAFALFTRLPALGDLNYFEDELLYFYIGQRMHDGLLPYVDLWDRKPPGLFALYYLFAGISRSVLSYQLAGWLSVALTAQAIYAVSRRISGRLGALLAGTLYLALLPAYGGRGGQAPIFYNLPIAVAALLLVSRRDLLRQGRVSPGVLLAMLSCSIAITMKQTAVFESVFWGGYALFQLAAARLGALKLLRWGLVFAAIGAAPMLLGAALYAAIGHFHEFWVAMVQSNLAKTYNPGHDLLRRLWILWWLQSPAWLFAAIGLAAPVGTRDRACQLACLGWFAAAVVGVLAIPNLHVDYVLPLLVPLAVMTAPFLQRGMAGPLFGSIYILAILVGTSAGDFDRAARSNLLIRAMVAQIEARDPHPRLFVFDGPVYLYALTASRPYSPLFSPNHLYFAPETNTSYLDTATVVRDWLAQRPSVIVIRHPDPGETRFQYNQATLHMAESYAQGCRWHFRQPLQNMLVRQNFDVYGGCGPIAGPV